MSEDDHPERAGFNAVLFPHSGLSEEGLGRILSFFENLTLFLPWHMDPPGIEGEETDPVQVVNPPEHMKPVTGFKGLLSEYRNWTTHNDLKGYTPLLRASLRDPQGEPTTQAIREALRPGERGKVSREPDDFTRWHLMLHLNRLMEEQEEEASSVLTALREGGSPLRGVVEEETEGGLFDDLPPFDSGPLTEPYDLEQVCEAWFGLFGETLREQDHLVTLNRHLLGHLSGTWEERYGAESLKGCMVTWLWPDLSGIGLAALAQERSRLFLDGRAGEVRSALQDFRKVPGEGLSRLKTTSRGLDRSWVHRYSPRILRFSVRYFPRFPEESLDRKGKALENVRDRVIIHVGEDSYR